MKIVSIFANQLYAFHYDGEDDNELRRLLALWNDIEYLYQFVMQNKGDIPRGKTIDTLVFELIKNAKVIDDTLEEISNNPEKNLGEFFKPLDNQEYKIVELSKQKARENYLRLFAIRIDQNCFVITGGAIKLHHLNKDRPHTQKEMMKINKCRDYLRDKSVFDTDSFYEFLKE